MGQVISWYPRANNRIVLFEVTDLEGHAMWGGEGPAETIEWFMRDPNNRRIIATQFSNYNNHPDNAKDTKHR